MPVTSVIRIELDDCAHGGSACTVYKTWSAFEATQFRETRSQALTAAVAQWRKHTRFMRKSRKEYQVAKDVSNDPTIAFARMLEQDIADERAAQALAGVAMRFYVDEPDNDTGIVPRREAA